MTIVNESERPLLPENEKTKSRNGTWFYASFHSATAMIGAGILGLPWAFSYLGWCGGCAVLLLAFILSYVSAELLVVLHEQDNQRYDTYSQLGQRIFGNELRWLVPLFQTITCVGAAISYVITGAICIQHVYELVYADAEQTSVVYWILIFGVVQLFLGQLPDFHSLRFVSMIGVIMAISYALISIIASAVHVLDSDNSMVSYGQRSSDSLTQIFGIGNAVGSIIYAFGGLSTMLEIQATLPSPSGKTMHYGVTFAYLLALVLYSLVAVTGYYAFGTTVNDNILISLAKPRWLVAIANAMVFLHVAAGYQVFSMIVYIAVENRFFKQTTKGPSKFLRILFRIFYTIATVVVAACIPYFSAVNGFIGALAISLGTFFFPQHYDVGWCAL
eukprot:TRINITY_DN1719_c0_g1_i7.p1 TRINITY_DN1719_c0_g1~~TRINITY_DN1719_c0_g1_i7.p1  ORF type:complete len:388 (+),score=27.02 TRINITY_DN1719_c0_g1_i7:59-1222(+)